MMFLGDADAFDALVYLMFNSTLRSERVLCVCLRACACFCVFVCEQRRGAAQHDAMRLELRGRPPRIAGRR